MDKRICTATGTITVCGDGWGRCFGPGSTVDVDETVTPSHRETWADVLGGHLALFEPVTPAAEPNTAPPDAEAPVVASDPEKPRRVRRIEE